MQDPHRGLQAGDPIQEETVSNQTSKEEDTQFSPPIIGKGKRQERALKRLRTDAKSTQPLESQALSPRLLGDHYITGVLKSEELVTQ